MNKRPIGHTAHQIQFLAINKIEQSFHNLYTSLLSVTNPFRNLSEILIFAIFADHTYIKSLHDLCPRKGKLSKKWPLKFKIKSLSLQIHTWWVNCISWCNIMTVTQNLENLKFYPQTWKTFHEFSKFIWQDKYKNGSSEWLS